MWFEVATKGAALGATCVGHLISALPVPGPLGLARKEHWWLALSGMTFPKEKALSLLQKFKFFVVIPGKWSSLKSPGHAYKDIKTIMVEVFSKKQTCQSFKFRSVELWTLPAFCKSPLPCFLAEVCVKLWANPGHLILLVGNNTKLDGSCLSSPHSTGVPLSVRNCILLSKVQVRFK